MNNAKAKKGGSLNTLPEDVHYEVKMLTQLFFKPNWHVNTTKRKREVTANENTHENRDGNDENVNLASDDEFRGIDMGGGGNDEDFIERERNDEAPFNDGIHNETVPEMNAVPELNGAHFIDEPKRPDQIVINYAKTAKFIDVKALKNNLWEKVNVISAQPNAEPVKEVDFQQVLQEIPKSTSVQDLPNLSVPFCFICLLHLANEKELSLEGSSNLDTLQIATS